MFWSTVVCQPQNVMASGLGQVGRWRSTILEDPNLHCSRRGPCQRPLARNVDSVAIRAGRRRPHPRAWETLAELAGVSEVKVDPDRDRCLQRILRKSVQTGKGPPLLSDSRQRLADVRQIAMSRAQWICCIRCGQVSGRNPRVGGCALSPMSFTRACHVRIW
jgi:hypothetical protein